MSLADLREALRDDAPATGPQGRRQELHVRSATAVKLAKRFNVSENSSRLNGLAAKAL